MSIKTISGKELSPIIMGTAGFSNRDNFNQYAELADTYVQMGGNCLDTARVYCDWLPDGHGASEEITGKWLASSGVKREEILLSTKGGHPRLYSMQTSRLSEKELLSDLTESLEHLKTDIIDLYFLHRDDESIPVEEIVDILNDMATDKIRYLGASNWKAERILKANEYANKKGLKPFTVSQPRFSYAFTDHSKVGDQTTLSINYGDDQWQKCTAAGIELMAYTSQAGGYFAKLARDPNYHPKNEYDNEENAKRFLRLSELSNKRNESISALSLAALLCLPNTHAIIGTTNIARLRESMQAQDILLTPNELEFLWGASV